MAEAYGKLTGRPGICFVTRGPGATNASIGVHTALQDSTPLDPADRPGRRATRRSARPSRRSTSAACSGPITKWVAEIDDARRIPELVEPGLPPRDLRPARARWCWRCRRTC